MKMADQQIIMAGFGGQGILSAGRILAYAGMLENKNVSWLPENIRTVISELSGH